MRLPLLLALAALICMAAPGGVSATPQREPIAKRMADPIVRVTAVHVCRATGDLSMPPARTPDCPRRAVEAVDPQGTTLWMLADVTVPAAMTSLRTPMAILMQAMASTVIYWDGERVSASGQVATSPDHEVPGQFVHIAPLRSDELSPGVHRLAVLLSSHHGPLRVGMPVHVLALAPLELVRDGVGSGSPPVLLALGALLLAAIYFAVVSISGAPRRPHGRDTALLATLILCALAQGAAELWRTFLPISYVGQIWRLVLILVAATGLGASLVAYATRRFANAWSTRALIVYAVAAGLVWLLPGFDLRTLVLLAVAGALAIGAALPAAWRGTPGARPMTVLLLLLTAAGVAETGAFLDRELFVGLTLLTLVLLVDHARQMRRAQAVAETAQQQVQQLELELQRRRLTPHWLLNMLNALTAWIEEEPATAVRMVGLLGDEFHRLAHPIDAPLIDARDELAACDRLLALMSLRSGRSFTLDAIGVAPELRVPPGVLHTLVENALTHGAYRGGAVFTVRQTSERGAAVLSFEAPYAEPTSATADPAPDAALESDRVEGFGLTYVRARLRAAFGDDASLVYGRSAQGGWRTVLRLGSAAS